MFTNGCENYVFKDYFDLNGHYLHISLQENQSIHIVSYNSSLLNGIKYETQINSEEINKKTENFSCDKLYNLIIQRIEEKKYIINEDENSINLLLQETSNILGQNKDIAISIPKNKTHITTDYEKVLSNEVNKLREENKKIINDINDLNNKIKLLTCIKDNNNINISNNNNLRGRHSNLVNNSSNIKQSSSSQIDNKKNSNNIDNKKSSKNNLIKPVKNSSIIQPKGDNNSFNNNLDNISSNNSNNNNNEKKDVNNSLSISKLCNLNYGNYPLVEISQNPFNKIVGYGANSYNGLVRNHNEDRLKIILDYKLNKIVTDSNGKTVNPNISYFAIYDGHGGNGCSNFLQEKLHNYLFSSDYFPLFPLQAIYQAYENAELNFELIAFDKENKKLLDKSGSCSLLALIISDLCFISYLGDSRGIYSFDSGNQLFQVTRDHKPNDKTERTRIEKAGGKIYKDTRLKIDGLKVKVNEKDAPGVKFPYRVSPGNLAVNNIIYIIIIFILFNIGSKNYWRFRVEKSFNRRIEWNDSSKALCE